MRVVIARVRYKTVDAESNADVITTAMPDEMLPRAMLAPSMAAQVIMENVGKGLPLFRLDDTFAREGVPELSPLFWERTRARLDPAQLAAELGYVDVPSTPLDTGAPAEQIHAG